MRVRGEYGFIGIDLSASFPQDIPSLEIGVNYDIVGDFTMFAPLWANKFFSEPSFICLKESVLLKAKAIYGRHKSSCGSKMLLGVHFRRGDYLAVSSLNLELDYYRLALALFPASKWALLIFSDDIEYCKSLDLFASYSVSYSAEKSDVLDMALMSICDGLVAANSTYSLWGGFSEANAGLL